MRNPDRINIFVNLLKELWHEYPDMRFGQLFNFICPLDDNIFYEDSDWLVILTSKLGVDDKLLNDPRIIEVFQENYYLNN